MTVVVANHLIEGPILISDSRATERKSGKPSDTATKILPLIEDIIVGIVGNSDQAAEILLTLRKIYILNPESLNPKNIIDSITKAAKSTNPVDINDSRCTLIFAYLDRKNLQNVSVDKLRYHLEKTGKPFIDGEQTFSLMVHVMSKKSEPREIDFYFPKSYVVELKYPVVTTRYIGLLEMDVWGAGASFTRERLEGEFYKLWSLETYKSIPWFKTMILAVSMEDIIKSGKDYFIGGFPQVVALTPNGIFFQSYESGSKDQDKHTTMKYSHGSWEQTDNKTGKIIKTFPGIFGKRKFDRSEIVDFFLN